VTVSILSPVLGVGRELHRKAWNKTLRPAGERFRRRIRRRVLDFKVEHIAGPPVVSYGPDEVVTTTVVRNGELHVDAFIRHHQALGVRHIVLLDNGSSDTTVERARVYPEVTVLRTTLPYARYENAMKEYLSRRFSTDLWNLCLDIDELWEYPAAERLALPDFVRYLNVKKYTAVVCQMLDLFSDLPLDKVRSRPGDDLQARYPLYDISAIRAVPYRYGDVPSDDIAMHSRGIRWDVFRTPNMLTKAALVRIVPGVRLFEDWHHAYGVQVADVTCLLRHYPFVETFRAKTRDAAATGRYGPSATAEYEQYDRILTVADPVMLKGPNARRLEHTDQLVEDGFLYVGADYEAWVRDRGQP
jgi:hypothetical protein